MTPSNGNIFCVTGPLCGKFTGEFLSQRPVTRSFDVSFNMCFNKRLSKQSRRRWFQTSSRLLWRHCNDIYDWTPEWWHTGIYYWFDNSLQSPQRYISALSDIYDYINLDSFFTSGVFFSDWLWISASGVIPGSTESAVRYPVREGSWKHVTQTLEPSTASWVRTMS